MDTQSSIATTAVLVSSNDLPYPSPSTIDSPLSTLSEPTGTVALQEPSAGTDKTGRTKFLESARQQIKELFQKQSVDKVDRTKKIKEILKNTQAMYSKIKTVKGLYQKIARKDLHLPAYHTVIQDINAFDLLTSTSSAGGTGRFWIAREIANTKLTDEEKKTLLSRTFSENWTRSKLRKEIRNLLHKIKPSLTESQILDKIEKYLIELEELDHVEDLGTLDAFTNIIGNVKAKNSSQSAPFIIPDNGQEHMANEEQPSEIESFTGTEEIQETPENDFSESEDPF